MFSIKKFRKGYYNRRIIKNNIIYDSSNNDIIKLNKKKKKFKKKNKTVRFSDKIDMKTFYSDDNDNDKQKKSIDIWSTDFEVEELL